MTIYRIWYEDGESAKAPLPTYPRPGMTKAVNVWNGRMYVVVTRDGGRKIWRRLT